MNIGAGGSCPRKGENEVRVFACRLYDARITVQGKDGAERRWRGGMSKPPDVFNLFRGQRTGFVQVKVRGEGFEAG